LGTSQKPACGSNSSDFFLNFVFFVVFFYQKKIEIIR